MTKSKKNKTSEGFGISDCNKPKKIQKNNTRITEGKHISDLKL